MSDDQSFANYPKSLSEIKAEQARDASKWTPRDVLINTLREYDEGNINTNTLLVLWLENKKTDDEVEYTSVRCRQSYTQFDSLLSLVTRVKHWFLTDRDD